MTKPPTQVLLSLDGPVAVITLFNPPMNVVTLQMTAELEATLATVRADDTVRAVVIAGHGARAFCAGSDITEFTDMMLPGQVVEKKLRRQNEVFQTLYDFPKPTIAAVNSIAYGGGLEIAVCCDLIVASTESGFCLPEINLGVFPSSGGTYRVSRRIGPGRARELMFLGEAIDAQTALAWGLVNRVCEPDQVMHTALALATKLASKPRQALSLCKEMITLSFDTDDTKLIGASLTRSDKAFSSAEAREGVRAFFAKEKPNYSTL